MNTRRKHNVNNESTILKRKKEIKEDDRPLFKVRIDSKTTITVRTKDAVKSWLKRYPKAELLTV